MSTSDRTVLVDARPPLLLADHPALDFLNSRAFPAGVEIEWLGDGDGLLRWMGAAGLLPYDGPERDSERRGLDAIAAEARAFREWLRSFVAGHAGGSLASVDALPRLGPLNALLATDAAYVQVAAREGALAWAPPRRRDLRLSLLQPLAAAAGDLVCTADFRRIRRCEGPRCTLWFLDMTKGGTRRWCSMALCENRAKVSAHRGRRRERTTGNIA